MEKQYSFEKMAMAKLFELIGAIPQVMDKNGDYDEEATKKLIKEFEEIKKQEERYF